MSPKKGHIDFAGWRKKGTSERGDGHLPPYRSIMHRRGVEQKRSKSQAGLLQLAVRLERETGIEPATNSLEGCDSTTELLPPLELISYKPQREI